MISTEVDIYLNAKGNSKYYSKHVLSINFIDSKKELFSKA